MKDLDKYEDSRLIELLKEKNPVNNKAFNVIYNRYSDKLHAFCLFKSPSRDDAAELFQETWIKFYNYASNGNRTTGEISLPAYLYQIARNLSIDKYRVRKNKSIQNLDELDLEKLIDPLNIHENYEKEQLLSLISLAVNNLSDIYKEAFVLRWFADLQFNEIAVITGETAECIKMRCYRAMSEVIKSLNPIIKEISK